MKKYLKTILLVLALLLGGVAIFLGVKVGKSLLGKAAGGNEPKNVRVQAEENSAIVLWETETASQGEVEYGINQASMLLKGIEQTATTNHKIVLSSLAADTTYYFRILSGGEKYDNNGIPYSFRTKPAEVVATPTLVPTVGLIKSCNVEEFKSKMGGVDPAYDFDKNGLVTTKDWLECLKQQK